MNQVLRYVVERLWQVTQSAKNRQLLGDLRHWMNGVTLSTVRSTELQQIQIMRLNQQYEPLLNLARLFLIRSSLQLSSGQTNTFAFLFDMNKLFENFIINFVRSHRDEILPVSLQGCQLISQAQGVSRHLAKAENGQAIFRLKPDLVFHDCCNKIFPVIVDTKYKLVDFTNQSPNIPESDIYQMYAYSQCYDCKYTILLYPSMTNIARTNQFTLFFDHSKVLLVKFLDLTVNLNSMEGQKKLIESLKCIFFECLID